MEFFLILLALSSPVSSPLLSTASADSGVYPTDEGKVKPLAKSEKPLKIAVFGIENNPFWIDVKAGTLAAKSELESFNATVSWVVPSNDNHSAKDTTQLLEDALNRKSYDAIALIASGDEIIAMVAKAHKAGIPIATFNGDFNKRSERLFFVGVDAVKQGQEAAKAMIAAHPDRKGEVAIITGFFSVNQHEQRRKGFEEYLNKNAPHIKIVERVENKDQADTAYILTQGLIKNHPNLTGIYVTAGGPFGAGSAVSDAGKVGKIKIICFDFVKETVEMVKQGVITGTLGQGAFSQGRDPAVRLFNYLVTKKKPVAEKFWTKSPLVTQANWQQYIRP